MLTSVEEVDGYELGYTAPEQLRSRIASNSCPIGIFLLIGYPDGLNQPVDQEPLPESRAWGQRIRIPHIPFELSLGDELLPDSGRMARWRGDSGDTGLLAAASAQAGFFVELGQFQALLESFQRSLEFFVGRQLEPPFLDQKSRV
jgi:hypothetical protein